MEQAISTAPALSSFCFVFIYFLSTSYMLETLLVLLNLKCLTTVWLFLCLQWWLTQHAGQFSDFWSKALSTNILTDWQEEAKTEAQMASGPSTPDTGCAVADTQETRQKHEPRPVDTTPS